MIETAKKYRKFFIISFVLGIIFIPVMDIITLQRDRNRNLLYGHLFWEYGLGVYDINDKFIMDNYDVSEDSLFDIEETMGHPNLTYEYPPAVLLFYSVFAKIPANLQIQRIMVNIVLFVIVNINLLLLLKMGDDKSFTKKRWFLIFVGFFFIADFFITITGGKMETLTNLFLLLSIYFLKKEDWSKAGIFLAIAVQIKVYPIFILPLFLIKAKKKAVWFFIGMIPLLFLFSLQTNMGASFIKHVSNNETYSIIYTNPLYYGHIFLNPLSIITIIIFGIIILKSIEKLKDKNNILIILPTLSFFLFSWQMPWYLIWFFPFAMLIENESDMIIYLKIVGFLGLMYLLGILVNLNYYISNAILYEFGSHFNGSLLIDKINNTVINFSKTIQNISFIK